MMKIHFQIQVSLKVFGNFYHQSTPFQKGQRSQIKHHLVHKKLMIFNIDVIKIVLFLVLIGKSAHPILIVFIRQKIWM